jgi:hypothetical protein
MSKKKKAELLYHLAIQCDMINGVLDHMSKDYVEDSWVEKEMDYLIKTAKQCIKENWDLEIRTRVAIFKSWDKADLETIIEDCLDAEGREYTEGNYFCKKCMLVESRYLSDLKREREVERCPLCESEIFLKDGEQIHCHACNWTCV